MRRLHVLSVLALATAAGLAVAAPAHAATDMELTSTSGAPRTGEVTITITATNVGPEPGSAQLYLEENNALDERPDGLDCQGGSEFAGTCVYNAVPAGQSVTMRQTFGVTESGTITYTAIVDSNGDTNPANNRRDGSFGGTESGDGGPGMPSTGGGESGGGGTDRVLGVSGFALTPFSFQAAARGASVVAPRSSSRGAVVTYRLTRAATATFRVLRPAPGRNVSTRRRLCVAPDSSNRTMPSCTRWVALAGSFRHSGRAGVNRFRFTGRLAGRRLPAGRYRLQITARSSTSPVSTPLEKPFRIRP